MNNLFEIATHFKIDGDMHQILPLGNGLINDSYKIETTGENYPNYVLQRINHAIFQDVEMLQRNIFIVTTYIRKKLEQANETDLDRKVITLVPAKDDKLYYFDGNSYWRVMIFISQSSAA